MNISKYIIYNTEDYFLASILEPKFFHLNIAKLCTFLMDQSKIICIQVNSETSLLIFTKFVWQKQFIFWTLNKKIILAIFSL